MNEGQGGVFYLELKFKDVGKGTDLGLSIPAAIIHELNGEITVESKLGVGSTFTIILTIMQPPS